MSTEITKSDPLPAEVREALATLVMFGIDTMAQRIVERRR